MNRTIALAICVSLLAFSGAPMLARADDKTDKIVTTTIVAAAIGGTIGLLIMIAARQAELSEALKKKSPARKARASISPFAVQVHF